MPNPPFDFAGRVTDHDKEIASQYIGSLYRPPDLVIAPKGYGEYLFRWYVIPRNREANVYFHIQTQSDPERPLHDHPWDNTSVILSGGYDEIIDTEPESIMEGQCYDPSAGYLGASSALATLSPLHHDPVHDGTEGSQVGLLEEWKVQAL